MNHKLDHRTLISFLVQIIFASDRFKGNNGNDDTTYSYRVAFFSTAVKILNVRVKGIFKNQLYGFFRVKVWC